MSHSDPEMNGPEMNEIEAALAAWTPRPPQIDRDRLMFEAGRASYSPAILAGKGDRPAIPAGVRPARYLWPLATSLSTAAALTMAFLLVQDGAPSGPADVDVATPIATASVAEAPPQRGGLSEQWVLPAVPDGTYLALRNRMLTTPSDQWPVPQLLHDNVRRGAAVFEGDAARMPPTSRNLLQEFLPPEPSARRGSPDPPARRRSPDPAETPAAHITEHQEALT